MISLKSANACFTRKRRCVTITNANETTINESSNTMEVSNKATVQSLTMRKILNNKNENKNM